MRRGIEKITNGELSLSVNIIGWLDSQCRQPARRAFAEGVGAHSNPAVRIAVEIPACIRIAVKKRLLLYFLSYVDVAWRQIHLAGRSERLGEIVAGVIGVTHEVFSFGRPAYR